MLGDFRLVQRQEAASDVCQNVVVRLLSALKSVPITSAVDFFRLATRHIRWELLDLARQHKHFQGESAITRRGEGTTNGRAPLADRPADADEPATIESWTRFHEAAEGLPPKERDVFSLLYYQGLTQKEAASVLRVAELTIRRRWLSARLRIRQIMKGERPE
jgi:RNA polymerase sigma-70 factor (ECF subfamily)